MSKTWNEETQKHEYTPSFVLEFRLLTSNSDEQELEKCFSIAGHINNVMGTLKKLNGVLEICFEIKNIRTS